MENNESIKAKTISSFFWSSSDIIVNQCIKLIIQIFIARLLVPKDFGIIGMITIFISISQSIMDSGLKNALIREKNSSQKDYSTVFYFNLIMAVLLYILLFFTAPTISQFYNEPKITSILRVLSLIIIINSFGLIQRTILTKNLIFKIQTKIDVISSIVSGVIAVIFAYIGFGVWSLVIQNLAMQFIQSIMLSLYNRWIPSLVFSIDSFKRLFGFGWKLLASGLIDTIYQNLYFVIIGKFFTVSILGCYTNAQKLRDVASQSATSAVQTVSYPVLSNIQEDNIRLKRGYQKIIKNTVFVTFPLMIGLSVVAQPLITILFGEKWINSISYFQILCFAGMLFPLHAINLNILQVKGKSNLFLRLEILKKMVGAVLITTALFLNFEIIGLIWVALINSIVAYVINAFYSGNLISYPIKEQLKDIFPIFIITILMGGIVYLCGLILFYNDLIKLIVQISIGGLSYIGISRFFKVNELKTIYEFIISIFKLKAKIESK